MKYILLSLAFLFLMGCDNRTSYKGIKFMELDGYYSNSRPDYHFFRWEFKSFCFDPIEENKYINDISKEKNIVLNIYSVHKENKGKKLKTIQPSSFRFGNSGADKSRIHISFIVPFNDEAIWIEVESTEEDGTKRVLIEEIYDGKHLGIVFIDEKNCYVHNNYPTL